jgi:hypothetical protein
MALVAGSGSAQLAALAVRLKAQGDTTIRPRLLQGLKAGAKPCIVAVKASGLDKLPHKGGLDKTVTDPPITVSVRTGARTAGVRLVTKAHGAEPTNDGWVRHPVFSRRTKVANGTTKGGKAKTKIFQAAMHGGYGADLGYGGSVKADWVVQQIPGAKGWWSETLANSAPLVEPELTAVMERISAQIQGGI